MKILLLGDYALDQHESMRRFAELLECEYRTRGHEVRLLRPAPYLGRPKSASTGLLAPLGHLGYIDKYLLFPPVLRRAKTWADVVHVCIHEYAVYTRSLADVPHLVTCHDLLALRVTRGEIPGERPRLLSRLRQRAILRGLNRAQKVACVSSQTLDDLLRLSKLAPGCVFVVHNGLNYPYAPMPADEAVARLARLRVALEAPFYMHVGNNSFYKNRLGVLRIFNEMTALDGDGVGSLVMVGKPFTGEIRAFVARHGLEDRVRELPGIDNEDLRALYSLARGFIFPSYYEGFGWPPLEAQACGCPVFVSNRPPMTEVGGEAARYFDPDDVTSAARLIVESASAREEMRTAGLENVKRFSTSAMVEGYLALYKRAIDDFVARRAGGST